MTLVRLHNDDWGYETNCFVCEATNERGLRIPFFHDDEADVVVAELHLGHAFSGAPTLLHGGIVLAVLDEAMAWAAIAIADAPGRNHCLECGDCVRACEWMIERRGDGPVPLLLGFFSGPQKIEPSSLTETGEAPAVDIAPRKSA